MKPLCAVERNPTMKLDDKDLEDIIAMHDQGMKCPSIARIFGVSSGTISALVAKGKKSGFESIRRKPRRPRYPKELIDKAVGEMEKGGYASEVAERNGISVQILLYWVRRKASMKYNPSKEESDGHDGKGKGCDPGEGERKAQEGAEGREGEGHDPKKITCLSPGATKEERQRVALLAQRLRQENPNINLKKALELVGMSKSTFFDELKRMEADKTKDHDIIEKMKEIQKKVNNTYGSPRMCLELKKSGISIGHNKVAKLMRQNGLCVPKKRVKYNSYKGAFGKTCGNLLLVERVIPGTDKKTTDRDFVAEAPLRKWTTDVTEFKTKEGKVYLAPIMDLFNQEIISFVCSYSPDMNQQFKMLDIAFARCGNSPLPNLIFHSDQGWQYQHKEWQRRLSAAGIRQSMSRKGNCHDNSVMENFFGRLKNECYYGHEDEFDTKEKLVETIKEYISFYNNTRIQAKLGGLSPVDYRLAHEAKVK